MTLTYLSSTLSEQEYFTQRFKQAPGTGRVTRAAINNVKYFCQVEFNRELIIVMADLRDEVQRTNHLDVVMTFLQKLITWSGQAHPEVMTTPNACYKNGIPYGAKDPDTIEMYVGQLRLYMRKVVGIPITSEDIKDYKFSYPEAYDKEEGEPLELEEFRLICDNETDFKRRMLYRIKRGAEARIGAMVQLRKKNFDVTGYKESKGEIPIRITFPRGIMKKTNGKSSTNVKYVLAEDSEEMIQLLSMIPSDEDLVFGTNEDPEQARYNEEQVWRRKVQRLGFTAKYAHNGRLKKNLHSIKAMTFTAAEEAVGLAYAHAYGDHILYTKTYLRWNEEKKIEKFRKLEKFISVYTKTVEVHDGAKTIEENKELKAIVLKLAEEKKLSTRSMPKDELKEMMTLILKEHNII